MAAIRPYLEPGVDGACISQIGDDQEGFFEFCAAELLPRLRAET